MAVLMVAGLLGQIADAERCALKWALSRYVGRALTYDQVADMEVLFALDAVRDALSGLDAEYLSMLCAGCEHQAMLDTYTGLVAVRIVLEGVMP